MALSANQIKSYEGSWYTSQSNLYDTYTYDTVGSSDKWLFSFEKDILSI